MGGREGGKKKYKRVQGLVKRTVSKSGSSASSALELQRKGEKGKKKALLVFYDGETDVQGVYNARCFSASA